MLPGRGRGSSRKINLPRVASTFPFGCVTYAYRRSPFRVTPPAALPGWIGCDGFAGLLAYSHGLMGTFDATDGVVVRLQTRVPVRPIVEMGHSMAKAHAPAQQKTP